MTEDPTRLGPENAVEGDELEPLIPAEAYESEAADLEFDESGLLVRVGGAAIEPRPPLAGPAASASSTGAG